MSETKDYNHIFESLAGSTDEDPDLVGIVAYGLYKQSKREWAAEIRATKGRAPTDDELRAYVKTWGRTRINGTIREAEQWLASYAGSVVAAEKPLIERDALKGKFGSGVLQSALGTLLYTAILLLLYAIVYFAGIDVISLFSKNTIPSVS